MTFLIEAVNSTEAATVGELPTGANIGVRRDGDADLADAARRLAPRLEKYEVPLLAYPGHIKPMPDWLKETKD